VTRVLPGESAGAHRYAPITQGTLRRFYRAAGIEVRFDPHGHLAGVHLTARKERTMSDRVTWEICPRCGDVAAVGWACVTPAPGRPAGEIAVEFDCPSGCPLDDTELQELTASDEGGPARGR